MTWPWRTPDGTRRGISDRLARHPAAERRMRLQEVAFRRLLVRLEISDPKQWVVKGGVALLLRLDPNRTSDDIDLVYMSESGEYAVAIAALDRAFAVDAGDFISFRFVTRPSIPDRAPDTIELSVEALLGERPWVRFDIDLGEPAASLPVDPIRNPRPLTVLADVDYLPELRALALPQQMAQKTCAMFERHGAAGRPPTRPRDLADIAMVAMQISGIRRDELVTALRAEEERRIERKQLVAPLPTALALVDAQERDWRARWGAATRHVALSFDEALDTARRFLDPVLDGSAGAEWNATAQRWEGS